MAEDSRRPSAVLRDTSTFGRISFRADPESTEVWITVIDYDNDDVVENKPGRPEHARTVSVEVDGVKQTVVDPAGVMTTQARIGLDEVAPQRPQTSVSDPDAEPPQLSDGYKLLLSTRPHWARVRWMDIDGINDPVKREYLRHGPLGKWADLAYDNMKRESDRAKAISFHVEDGEQPREVRFPPCCVQRNAVARSPVGSDLSDNHPIHEG